MLDIGWTEILVIAIVLIIVVGPKDLPQMLRTFGRMTTKMRGMASEFRSQFDEALREADLDDVKKSIGEARKLNPMNTIRDAVNPLKQMGKDIKADIEKAGSTTTAAAASASVTGDAPAQSEPIIATDTAAPATPVAAASAASTAVAAEPIKGAPVKASTARAAKPVKTAKASETADVPESAAGKKNAAGKKSATGTKTAVGKKATDVKPVATKAKSAAPAKKAATRKTATKKDQA